MRFSAILSRKSNAKWWEIPIWSFFEREEAQYYRDYDLKLTGGEATVSYDVMYKILGVVEYFHVTKSLIKLSDGKEVILGVVLNMSEMHKINSELIVAKEKAEQSDKLKSAFLANMSHEIRTPLNAIVGFSELLVGCENPEEKAECVSIINTNNELLLRLIGDILDLSKIESGLIELKYDRFDLKLVFEEVFTAFKQKMLNSKVQLIGDNPYAKCMVYLDKNRLIQVWTNFMTNAIKYTPSGHIKMGYRYQDEGIRIYVEDTGIGISKEKHDKVFERFEKLDTFAQGTGLGLSICKAITEVKHGHIGFESEEGKGSTFWAWFPSTAQIEPKEEALAAHDERVQP